MSRYSFMLALLCTGLAPWLYAAPALAVDAPLEKVEAPTAKVTPLGVRQQRVERMMDDLDRTFKNLAQSLEKSEPERAARLIKALEESKQMLIQNRMGDITKLLNDTRLDVATDEQKRILSDLEKLLAILLKEDLAKNDKLEEALKLEKWKQEINRVLEEERGHRQESGKVANKDQTLAALAARIAALKALIARQQALTQQSEQAKGEASRPLTPLADKQQTLRQDTQALAKQLGGKETGGQPAGAQQQGGGEQKSGTPPQGGSQQAGGKESGGKESGGKESGGKESGGKESGGKESGGKESGGKESGGKESGGKESGGKESGGKESGGKESGGQQSGGQQSGGQQSGGQQGNQQPLEKAATHQQNAENNLQQGQPKGAAADQQQAVAEMQKALADLEREQKRIASLPKDHQEQLAKKQDATTARTGKLNEEMKQGDKQSGGQQGGGQQGGGQQGGGQQGGGQQGGSQQDKKPTPGQPSVEQAQQSMQQGSDDLRTEDPSGAAQKQDQAIRNLEDALKEIEKRLAQLREQLQLDKLARLETRFREMLDRQKKVTAATAELEQKRDPEGQLKRTERLQLASLAEEERALGAAAQVALEIILEDGTSVVFPEVVAQVRDDLNRLGEMLDGQKTGNYTQLVQKDTETTLEELIAALQKAQQKKKGGGGGGSGGGGEQNEPLLPGSAELKLLKASQLRVNRRTVALAEAHKAAAPDELAKKELTDLATRQQEIATMTERIIERN